MLHIIDFPHRFAHDERGAVGSIDEISWITTVSCGDDAASVPIGAVLFIRGWASRLDRLSSAREVVIVVDGNRTYVARVGMSRPDVAEQLENAALTTCGYEALIPTGRLTPGEHKFAIAILDSENGKYAYLGDAGTFTIAATSGLALPSLPTRDGEVRGRIDEIADESNGSSIEEPEGPFTIGRGARLFVRGWACTERGIAAFDELYAVVDGAFVYRATYGLPRPDVAAALEASGNDGFGFEISIPTVDLPPGTHRLEMYCRDGADVLDRFPAVVSAIVGEPLPVRIALRDTTLAHFDDVVRIERTAGASGIAPLRLLRGDRLFVRGWAIDKPANSLAAGVILLVDETREVVAVYGLPRPDVAETLGQGELMRCGFTAEISTDDLAAGAHTVVCRVLARDGRGALATVQHFAFEVDDV